MARSGCCRGCRPARSSTAAILLILITAVPIALIASLERSPSIKYHSRGWIRECAKWDALGRRFLVSTLFDGVVAEIPVPEAAGDGALQERTVVADGDVAGNASLGIAVDRARRRLLVVYADALRFRFSAVAAYELDSWDRLFLTQLSGAGDEDSFADDVAVDEEGNAYVTDAQANKIWKVGSNGELLSVIRSEVFVQRKEWYYNFVGLNGIVYHPNGYLLVIHTASGYLFKMDPVKEEASVVKVTGSLLMGDGMNLLSPTRLVIAGSLSTKLVESSDDWKTANVLEKYVGPVHRIASSATVKDGKVYINHLIGGGLAKRTHVIAEAVFMSAK